MRALSEIKGFGPKRLEALEKRGILSSLDLIERLPTGVCFCFSALLKGAFVFRP